MDYAKLLVHSFVVEKENRDEGEMSRLEYLSRDIFDFTTYDGEMDELFSRKAIEVCAAISGRTTFDYIKDAENYRWFLIMCNMSFFAPRLEWGTSIRGAWWDHGPKQLESCGLWDGYKQIGPIHFQGEQWLKFIAALVEFAAPEMAAA